MEIRDAKMAAMVEEPPKKKKAKAGPKPKAAAEPPRLRLPAGVLSQPQLKPLVPEGGSIWRGNSSHSWHGHMPPFARDAASWHAYGHRGAAVLVLRSLWRKKLLLQGLTEAHCPVEGLFEGDGASALPPS